ncbi:MAG TPA: hypothetical protein ENN39_01070 [Desulfonatronum sp.]|nr:hypothetical protein [Desulfonatronum sp.]
MNLQSFRDRLFFDRKDYELLRIVNDVLKEEDPRSLKSLLIPFLHPHGIKEMAASTGLRIAYAVIKLFRSLERNNAGDRLRTLRALRDEVFSSSGTVSRKNTARVLLQIMKELVRGEDEERKLRLAHDFRDAAMGRPRTIARQLRKYHLVEMPEQWNQIAFDDHVHDANTKGRKSATHLIMDAWIKGIRRLRVIYYNYLVPEVAEELMKAAEIMGVNVRVGLEFSTRFRDRYIRYIWTPRGFSDTKDFLEFISQPELQAFMAEGRAVSEYQQAYIFKALEAFNKVHRLAINQEFSIQLEPLSRSDLLALVGTGQPSLHHLGKLIHDHLLPHLQDRLEELRECCTRGDARQRQVGHELIERMNALDIDAIIDGYLRPANNPDIHNPFIPSESDEVPDLLHHTPHGLLQRLERLFVRYRITLSLSGLRAEDVLEILYECRGRISRLETFNFKDFAFDRCPDNPRILDLQAALNSGNALRLKRCVQSIIQEYTQKPDADQSRVEHLQAILRDLETLRGYYRSTTLKSRIGTDSTGQSARVPGMGLVVVDTLPGKCRRQLKRVITAEPHIPVRIEVVRRRTYGTAWQGAPPHKRKKWSGLRRRPFLGKISRFCLYEDDWVVRGYQNVPVEQSNIRILGGYSGDQGNNLHLDCTRQPRRKALPGLRYVNTNIKNCLKILVGLVPAFATFALTRDWWLLAYFGAFIWFGITGLRNIIQSVLGVGGLRRSPLLRWSEYVKWNRIADSLMYTGFSVPLLDYLVKSLFLEQGLGVTAQNSPFVLYATIALVNALYLAGHNLFRGLPRAAAMGNVFRTVLSIPLALLFNFMLGAMLAASGVPAVGSILQNWAAIISKLASDIVAGFIEGFADRTVNFRERFLDYEAKLKQLFDIYARLELQHPEEQVLHLLECPERFVCAVNREEESQNMAAFVNALDLMYFWMYQPRARHALQQLLLGMNTEERKVFLLSQYVLQQEREISQLFLDGLVGKNFSTALAFYLGRWRDYLDDLQRMALRFAPMESSPARAENTVHSTSR